MKKIKNKVITSLLLAFTLICNIFTIAPVYADANDFSTSRNVNSRNFSIGWFESEIFDDEYISTLQIHNEFNGGYIVGTGNWTNNTPEACYDITWRSYDDYNFDIFYHDFYYDGKGSYSPFNQLLVCLNNTWYWMHFDEQEDYISRDAIIKDINNRCGTSYTIQTPILVNITPFFIGPEIANPDLSNITYTNLDTPPISLGTAPIVGTQISASLFSNLSNVGSDLPALYTTTTNIINSNVIDVVPYVIKSKDMTSLFTQICNAIINSGNSIMIEALTNFFMSAPAIVELIQNMQTLTPVLVEEYIDAVSTYEPHYPYDGSNPNPDNPGGTIDLGPILNMLVAIGEYISNGFNNVISNISNWFSSVNTWLSNIYNKLVDIYNSIDLSIDLSGITNLLNGIYTSISNFFNIFTRTYTIDEIESFAIVQALNNFANIITNAVNTLTTYFNNYINNFTNSITHPDTNILTILVNDILTSTNLYWAIYAIVVFMLVRIIVL